VLRHDTGAAMAAAADAAAQAAGAVVDKASGRRRAMPAATRHPMDDFGHERRMRRLQSFEMRLAIGLVIGALALGIMAWYRQPSQRADWTPQEAPLLSYAERFREPAMDCDLQSSVRREVRVRQLIVHP
jgi:hypothetical protein